MEESKRVKRTCLSMILIPSHPPVSLLSERALATQIGTEEKGLADILVGTYGCIAGLPMRADLDKR